MARDDLCLIILVYWGLYNFKMLETEEFISVTEIVAVLGVFWN